jgi:hypothetical protein
VEELIAGSLAVYGGETYFSALCWQSSDTSYDAACTMNCVRVTAANGTSFYPLVSIEPVVLEADLTQIRDAIEPCTPPPVCSGQFIVKWNVLTPTGSWSAQTPSTTQTVSTASSRMTSSASQTSPSLAPSVSGQTGGSEKSGGSPRAIWLKSTLSFFLLCIAYAVR